MKTLHVLLILLLLTMAAFNPQTHAQLYNAHKLYHLYRYAEAIPLYLKAIEKEKNPDLKAEATSMLADCYRLTSNPEQASEWYAKAIQRKNVAPVNYLYYGEALQSKGDYKNAKAAFLTYSRMVPSDPAGRQFAASCDLPEKWENISPEFEIQNIPSLNSKWSDFSPVYYKDGLMFTSDRRESLLEANTYGWTNNNYLDMYFAKQEHPEDPFGTMKEATSLLINFNKPYNNASATFSPDYHIIYFTRSYNDNTEEKDNFKTHRLKIYYAKTKGKKWTGEKPFFLNSRDYSVAHPSLSTDQKTIFFSSDMPGGFGAFDIWFCTMKDGKWGDPVNAGKEINTFGKEAFPFILNDSTLYFASNGLPGYGGMDIFVSHKKDGNWQTPVNLKKPVNSSYDDFSFVLDNSNSHGFFSSNRPGGLGSDDIYAFKRLQVISETKPGLQKPTK
jgi:tetratricopeptide (TPR) repeat protein